MKEDLETQEHMAALQKRGIRIPESTAGAKRSWTEAELSQREAEHHRTRIANRQKMEEYRAKVRQRRADEASELEEQQREQGALQVQHLSWHAFWNILMQPLNRD